jgi:hypothetical protein
MNTALALCWMVYGGDVTALGDRDFATRDAAHKRLRAAGLAAVPALEMGLRTANPEAMNRTRILLDRYPTRIELLVHAALHNPLTTKDQVRDIAALMMTDGWLRAAVYARVDELGAFHSASSQRWAELTPYASRSRVGDCVMVIETARTKILAPKPVAPVAPNWFEDD